MNQRFIIYSFVMALIPAVASGRLSAQPAGPPEPAYTNIIVADVPWSIHVVKLPRTGQHYQIHSRHAANSAWGMSTLVEQIAGLEAVKAKPVAAINGGFYLRDNGRATPYAGSPRGLQIIDGEVYSAPSSNITFWVDVVGELHATATTSRFEITWPDGRITPFSLNSERTTDGIVLYTPAAGTSTHTTNGLELILERQENSRWLPLKLGRTYPARVREVRQAGDSGLSSDTMVLSIGPAAAKRFNPFKAGDLLQISTMSQPVLPGAKDALSAGPVLVNSGKRLKFQSSPDDPYEFSSMLERHPRSAIGWNADWIFLVEVDGRQKDLSDGMTLEELANFLVKLGCREAVNLDGGGSSTLWYDGTVRNSPCDGYERPIANSLVIVEKPAKPTPPMQKNQQP